MIWIAAFICVVDGNGSLGIGAPPCAWCLLSIVGVSCALFGVVDAHLCLRCGMVLLMVLSFQNESESMVLAHKNYNQSDAVE